MNSQIKFKSISKITETDILKICIFFMCVSGMLQSSIVFQKWEIVISGCKYMVLFGSALIVFANLKRKKTFGYVLKTISISVLILITCLLTGDFSYLLVCMILVLSRGIRIEDFVKISYKVLSIFGGGYILLWIINCVINLGYPIYYFAEERRISFLFTHPNIAALKLGWGIVMYVWLHWTKLTNKKIFRCFIAILLLYWTTKADSCLILLLYILLVFIQKSKLVQKLVVWGSKYCFLILGGFNFLIAVLYMNDNVFRPFIRALDYFFSRRFAMAYLAIEDNGLSFIGQKINTSHEWELLFNFGNYTIDNLYIYFYVCIGIVYFVLISIGFYQLGKYKDYRSALIVLIFSLYSITEVHVLYLSNCFALLLLKCVIFKEKKIE